VSHQLDRAREFCSRALWLQAGELVMDDEIDGVLQAYRAAARAPEGTGQA
jgi:ABC-type polysaccharide/polyol phosphate transport system ATPase subunit